jgi:hypothetical protein
MSEHHHSNSEPEENKNPDETPVGQTVGPGIDGVPAAAEFETEQRNNIHAYIGLCIAMFGGWDTIDQRLFQRVYSHVEGLIELGYGPRRIMESALSMLTSWADR